MGMNDLVRIGIFYDGYYFYKVSNYYKYVHERRSRISIAGLHTFIRSQAAAIAGADIKQCQIIDAHYFKGRASAKDLGDKVQAERIFDDILMRENIVTHYLPLRMGPNNTLHEKGIDVWLALEAYEMAIYKKFDIIALVVCDGDYVPLVRKLNAMGLHVMLISWDFDYYNENGVLEQTRTAQALIEEVYHPVQMHRVIDLAGPRDDLVKDLFVTEKEIYYTPDQPMMRGPAGVSPYIRQMPNRFAPTQAIPGLPGVPEPPQVQPVSSIPQAARDANTEISVKQSEDSNEYHSTIRTLIQEKGIGFISAPEVNNIFFHATSVVNADYNQLEIGMPVRYIRVENAEKTKIDGAPRYNAVKVWVEWEEYNRTLGNSA